MSDLNAAMQDYLEQRAADLSQQPETPEQRRTRLAQAFADAMTDHNNPTQED